MRKLATVRTAHPSSIALDMIRLAPMRAACHFECLASPAVSEPAYASDSWRATLDHLAVRESLRCGTPEGRSCHSGGSDQILFYTGRFFNPRVLAADSPEGESSEDADLYEVRIIDNDHNTYLEVMEITMLALGISQEQAFAVAWEVDHRGFCVVAVGPREEAEATAGVIRTIGIEVQVTLLGGGTA